VVEIGCKAIEVVDAIVGAGRRRLMITGRRVKIDKNTNLAIKVGSRNNDVKLSPPAAAPEDCRSSVWDVLVDCGRANRERMLPTDAVT